MYRVNQKAVQFLVRYFSVLTSDVADEMACFIYIILSSRSFG